MRVIPFGPLLIHQKIDNTELQYLKNEFLNSDGFETFNTFLPSITKRKRMNPNKGEYNQILKPYIQQYLNVMGWKGNYRLKSLWGNSYDKHDYIPPHIHSECDLSFVIFLQMPPKEFSKTKGEGAINFMYGEQNYWQAKVTPITLQEIVPEEGDIFIFPQNLQHYTTPFLNDQIRKISLAGNIILESYE